MATSVEIRKNSRNEYECGWGQFENPDANPARPLHHLLLVTGDYVKQLLNEGPLPGPCGGMHSVSVDGQRILAHMDLDGQRTTWELFEAHWWDDGGPEDTMIGRWPD